MPTSTTTPGQILLREIVPEDMKEYLNQPLNKKGGTAFFDALARRHPEDYVEVMHKMTDLANQVSTEYGRWTSLSLDDLELPPRTRAFREMLRQRVDVIAQNPKLTPPQKSEKIVALIRANIDKAKTLLEDEGVLSNNSFALSSRHGFRGNQTQLMQMLFGDMLVSDNNDRPIPFPVLHSYAEGLSPLETWAGSYGSRKGYCIGVNTPVRMGDGSRLAIQRIRVGDMVMGCDGLGTPVPVRVVEVLDQGEKMCFHFYFQRWGGGGTVSVTSTLDHKVVESTPEGCRLIPVSEMDATKHLLISGDGGSKGSATFVGAIRVGMHQTFDLSVDHPSHLFVLDNGVVVSNSAVQFSTADTGYYAKQLAHMNTGVQVLEEDCGSATGTVMDPHSDEAAGRYTATDIGKLKAGSLLTADAVRKIRQNKVVVRSPLTCLLPHGVCQKCVGLRADGKLPGLNSFVSLEASRVVTEPMTQKLALAQKHVGGQVGVNDSDAAGFEEIDQFVQVPETFKGAVLSDVDGVVTKIETAPQGGSYVYVDDNERYHIPEGRNITVRKGASVQAGDQLTDGTMNPADIAKYRGIGEGRRYFVEKFGEILKRNGVGALPQNLELLARSYIQNVRVTDPDGVAGYRFGEILPYEAMQARYVPRGGAALTKLRYAQNQYLEQPAAHYTIGTRITPAVAADLQAQGLNEVIAHKEAPGFQPHITRAAARSTDEQDWKARLGGFYLKDAYRDMATLGAVDEPEGRPSTFAAIMDPSRLKDIK